MPRRAEPSSGPPAIGELRDRVLEFRRIPSEELHDNAANWRTHPYAQQAAIGELLEQVGIAGALTAYYSERNDGRLTLIDGHERRSRQADWPVVILDVTDEEADLLLLTLDPVAGMATAAPDELDALLATTHPGTAALEDLLQDLGREVTAADDNQTIGTRGLRSDDDPTPSMALEPFEHYDYIVVLARNTHDWLALQDELEVEKVEYRIRDGRRKFGVGRVIDAKTLLDRLRATRAQ